MEININNRAGGGGGRRRSGRPTKAEVEARPEPIQVVPVAVPVGITCPCCGRGMVPKTLRSTGDSMTRACTLCGGRFKQWLDRTKNRWLAQPL
jgi:hypothetical protein